MKVLLLDIYRKDVDYRISKDTNGSYGTGNDYGDSLLAKFLKKISKRTNFWPPLYLMYGFGILEINLLLFPAANIIKQLLIYYDEF